MDSLSERDIKLFWIFFVSTFVIFFPAEYLFSVHSVGSGVVFKNLKNELE